jgi:hypothetical protein
MILDREVHPENQLYYTGALILGVLKTFNKKIVCVFELYEAVKKQYKITLPRFFLSLDWLFLLSAIEGCEQGVKCVFREK